MKQDIIDFFSEVKFNEKYHTYSLQGVKLSISVSGIIKEFVKPVDFRRIAEMCDKRDKLPPGATSKMWKNKSDLACIRGDKAHYFGELYAFHRNIEPTDKLEEQIKKFWDSLPDHIVPVFTELVMYHKVYSFGGMCDILLYNKSTGKYLIADYKTNADLFKCYKDKKLTGVFSHLDETNYNKYQIQFSAYQVLLEQVLGVEVEKRVLIWVKEDNYELMLTDDYTDIIKEHLKTTCY